MAENVVITAQDLAALGQAAARAAASFADFANNFQRAASAIRQTPVAAAAVGGMAHTASTAPAAAQLQGEISKMQKALGGGNFGSKFSASFLAKNPQLAAMLQPGAQAASTWTKEEQRLIDKGFAEFGRRLQRGYESVERANERALDKQTQAAVKQYQKEDAQRQKNAARIELVNERALAQQTQAAVKQFKKWGDIADQEQKLKGPGTDWKMGLFGAGAGLFSPWIGARMMSQAFPGVGIGNGGGGAGGKFGSWIFGSGGLGGFAMWYLGLQAASRALKAAFDELTAAVRRGGDLYRSSAKAGVGSGQLAHLQAAFGVLGLSPEMAEKMMEQAQFGRGSKMSIQGILAGANSGVFSRAEMQGIMNLSKELKQAWIDVAGYANRTAQSAAAMFNMQYQGGVVKTAWKALWSDIVQGLYPVITIGQQLLKWIADFGLMLTWLWRQIEYVMAGVVVAVKTGLAVLKNPFKDPNVKGIWDETKKQFGLDQETSFGKQFGMPLTNRPDSSWEKMGLIVHGGFGGQDYARQTAQNTKKAADLLAIVASGFQGNLPTGQQPAFNSP